ncbi:MAG: hypothetical protein KKD63_06000 [Proteobacteria bacterium]|nr:hypothetical protein [Desulfobulbaceae bacterium]MBU4152412.1 hypothetical protein [Pseudomonadota bacterium]
MSVWKLSFEGETHYYHLCGACTERSEASLIKAGWHKLRDGEPVSCNECTLKCALTREGLWGAEDAVRYGVCATCLDYESCPLKGRHYC